MAQCKYCGRKGFFLSVSSQGLCGDCVLFVKMDVDNRVRIINDSIEIIHKSTNLDTRLSRCDLLLEQAQALQVYETKGIDAFSFPLSNYIRQYGSMRDEIVEECMSAKTEQALLRAETASSVAAKVTALDKGILAIAEARKEAKQQSKLDRLEEKLRTERVAVQVRAHLNNASKAEFKGQDKKALDQYQEALYVLQTINLPKQTHHDLEGEIMAKVRRLSANGA